jgi:hypothetical protein
MGKESSAGTLVAATRKWYGQGSGELEIDDMLALHRGNRSTRTSLAYASTQGVDVDIAYSSDPEIGMAWDEMPYIFGQLDGGNSGVNATADKDWTIAPSQTAGNSQEAYTIEIGDDAQEYEVGYCQASDFTISASTGGMTQLEVNWFGRQPVKSSKTAVSNNTAVRIPGYLWIPKWATAQSGIAGASDVTNFMTDFSITHQTGLTRRHNMSGVPYFSTSVESLEQTATVTMHVESSATAVSQFYDKKRAQTVDFMNLHATGPTLGSGTYAASLTYALLYTDVKVIASNEDGVNLYEITAETVYDSSWATNFGATFTCSIASIT